MATNVARKSIRIRIEIFVMAVALYTRRMFITSASLIPSAPKKAPRAPNVLKCFSLQSFELCEPIGFLLAFPALEFL